MPLTGRNPAIPEYPDLGSALRGVCDIWCQEQGYTDPFFRNGEWWAYPPGGVMPVLIKMVMAPDSQRPVRIGTMTIYLFPDGSLTSLPGTSTKV
ncbi:MAG: hypothetical protein AAGB01_04695 [Cyanobacteria bacterium P01_F01_bin.42]